MVHYKSLISVLYHVTKRSAVEQWGRDIIHHGLNMRTVKTIQGNQCTTIIVCRVHFDATGGVSHETVTTAT